MNETQRHRVTSLTHMRREITFACASGLLLCASVVRCLGANTDPLDMVAPTTTPFVDPAVVPVQRPPIPTPDAFPPRPDMLNRPIGPAPIPGATELPLPAIL